MQFGNLTQSLTIERNRTRRAGASTELVLPRLNMALASRFLAVKVCGTRVALRAVVVQADALSVQLWAFVWK